METRTCTCPTPDFHAINCPAHDDTKHWAYQSDDPAPAPRIEAETCVGCGNAVYTANYIDTPAGKLCIPCQIKAKAPRIKAEATARPWHFETCLYKNSADAEYRIMGTNEDAGKTGVSYSGRFLAIATTESREDALLIVQAVNSHQALVDALREIVKPFSDPYQIASEALAALGLAEGKQ